MKKKNTALFAGIIVLAFLLTFYLVLHNKNKEDDGQEQEETTVTAYESKKEDISSVSIQSDSKEYAFTKDGNNWKYDADADFPLNSSSFEEIIAKFESIAADRVIDNSEDVAEFGLDNPSAVVKIVKTTGDTDTLSFGDTNSVTNNSYMTVNEDNTKVYMVASTIVTALQFDINNLAEKEEFPSITSSTVKRLIVEKDGNKMSVEKDESSGTGWSYKGWDGRKNDADTSKATEYLEQISGLAWGTYVSKAQDNLSTYGLDNPTKITIDYQVSETASAGADTNASITDTTDADTITNSTDTDTETKTGNSDADTNTDSDNKTETKTVDKEEILYIGNTNESGDYYAQLQGQSNIYTVSASSVDALLNTESSQFMSSYISNYIFVDIDSVTVVRNGSTYEFTKKTEEKNTAEDKTAETVTTYYMNGEEIELTDFSTFYSHVTDMECQEWLDEVPETQEQPEMSIRFVKQGGLDVTVDYIPYDSNFYLVKDSKGNASLTNKMKVKDMMNAFEKFLEKMNK